jgi:hypothetical protein
MSTDCKDTKKIEEELDKYQSQLPAILEDFKKYYVLYNKDPQDATYQQMFQNIKSNLNTLNTNLFKLSTAVETCINNTNISYTEIDDLIQSEKEKNRDIKLELGILEQNNNASTELISDYKNIYEYEYLRNWSMVFSILIVGFTISKIFKSPTPNVNTR